MCVRCMQVTQNTQLSCEKKKKIHYSIFNVPHSNYIGLGSLYVFKHVGGEKKYKKIRPKQK